MDNPVFCVALGTAQKKTNAHLQRSFGPRLPRRERRQEEQEAEEERCPSCCHGWQLEFFELNL